MFKEKSKDDLTRLINQISTLSEIMVKFAKDINTNGTVDVYEKFEIT